MEWVVNFKLRPPYPRNPATHWIGSWMGSRVGLDVLEKSKSLLPLSGVEPRIVKHSDSANRATVAPDRLSLEL
jgi:hypothetical protein